MKIKFKILKVILSVFLFAAFVGMVVVAQAQVKKNSLVKKSEKKEKVLEPVPGGKYTEHELIQKDVGTAIKLLTNYEPQSQWKLDLATRAYEVFSKNKDVRFSDLVADKKFWEICDSQNIRLLGGPMLGQVSESGASVWVRTLGNAAVTVRVKDSGGAGLFGPVEAKPENDYAAVIKITGLQPNKSYAYSVYLDGTTVSVGEGILKTVSPQKTRIVFGSCSHRWGLANPIFWETMLSRNADALLAYGDIAVQDREFNFGMHRFDYFLREMQAPWRHMVANLPVYASWDDHDYYSNDHWGLGIRKLGETPNGTDADRLGIRRVFQTSWNNPSYGFNNEKGGIFFRTRIGAADVIMTDNRYFRGTDGPYLGEGQMKWLEEQLLECKGPFIIITCGTLWSDYKANGKDSWGVFDPAGREHLFSFIEKNHIPGVLLLSGDWHGARGFEIPRPSGYTFYEFQPASLGGRGRGSKKEKGSQNLKKNWLYSIGRTYAFGEFTFDTLKEDPTVTYRLILEDGTEFYKITLTRSKLTPL